MKCNWFWGSHGCDLDVGHEGTHLCGAPEDPCSKHDGTRVQFHYVGGDWSGEWLDSTGFCLGDGTPRTSYPYVNHPPCGDPDRCEYRENPGHAWSIGFQEEEQ